MDVRVLFHDRCFDGLASAATFSRFFREKISPEARFDYVGLTHAAAGRSAFDAGAYSDAPVHACLDFRYSADPRLTWWFDHHQSAFEQPEHEALFRERQNERHFWDPAAPSCAGYIARVAQERFGFDPAPLAELIHWAELIDSARFPDARTAVALEAPAMQLMLLAEATAEQPVLHAIIRQLVDHPLSEVVASAEVQSRLQPLLAAHHRTVALVAASARCAGPVCHFDVADEEIDNFNKFIGYHLHPDAVYSVGVSRGARRAKVSVGSSPWRQSERRHNIADLCARYGGGGHPAVGAISFPPDQVEEARRVAAEVVTFLQG